jgi:predicted nucleotidyltransferase
VTKDIDLFLKPDIENAKRCLDALKELGMGTAELTTPEDICATEVTIFKDVVRLDVLTRVKGLSFPAAWSNKVWLELDNVHIPAISIKDLIKTKRAAGRREDIQDIKILKLALSKK